MKKIASILILVFAFTLTTQAQRTGERQKFTAEQHAALAVKKMTLILDLSEKQQNQIRPLIGAQAANKKAAMLKGDTGENLIGLLERRLDAVVYRAKLSTTIFSARQLINHGHVKVNGKKVNIGSYVLKEEDTIEIRDKSKQLAFIDIALANKERETPEYIQLDEKNKKVKFVRTPKFEEVPYPVVMEPNLVIEYYSR